MSGKVSIVLTETAMRGIVQMLEKLGWVVYTLEEHDDWVQIAPSDSLILMKQLEDAAYNDAENVPYFLVGLEPDEAGLYTLVFPKGQDFTTTQELIVWADSF